MAALRAPTTDDLAAFTDTYRWALTAPTSDHGRHRHGTLQVLDIRSSVQTVVCETHWPHRRSGDWDTTLGFYCCHETAAVRRLRCTPHPALWWRYDAADVVRYLSRTTVSIVHAALPTLRTAYSWHSLVGTIGAALTVITVSLLPD